MKRDPLAEGLRWLERTRADREGAQLLFDGGSYHQACFVGQQVAQMTDLVLELVQQRLG